MNAKPWKIIGIPSNDTGVKILFPIYEKLKEDPSFHILFFNIDSIRGENCSQCLVARGMPCVAIPPADRLGFSISQTLKKPFYKKTVFYDVILDLLKKEQPDLILLTSDMGAPENVILSASCFLNIPVAIIQDGFLSLSIPPCLLKYRIKRGFMHLLRKIGIFVGPIYQIYGVNGADYLLMMGELYKEKMLKLGFSPGKVFVAGQPRYDLYVNHLVKQFTTKREFPFRILIALSALPAYYKAMAHHYFSQLGTILTVINDHYPDIQAVIKPHPRFDLSEFRSLLSSHGQWDHIRYESPHRDILQLIPEVDFVLSDFSTAVAEGLLVGKPGILVRSIGKDFFPDVYTKTGIAYIIDEPQEIPAALESYVSFSEEWKRVEQNMAEYLGQTIGYIGNATDRVIEVLHQILEKEKE